eukprot:5560334-Amphidinium_carterae.2
MLACMAELRGKDTTNRCIRWCVATAEQPQLAANRCFGKKLEAVDLQVLSDMHIPYRWYELQHLEPLVRVVCLSAAQRFQVEMVW